MPIASGAKGRASIFAMPSQGTVLGESRLPRGLPLGGWHPKGMARGTFRSRPFSTQGYTISGVTKDSTGAALGAVTVDLFDTRTDALIAATISDGSGNFSFGISGGGSYYLVAYKVGVPDVGGTTVNTLVGA